MGNILCYRLFLHLTKAAVEIIYVCIHSYIYIYILMFVKQSKKNTFWTASPLKMGLTYCPKTTVTNYQPTLHNIPEEQRPQTVRCAIHELLFSLLSINMNYLLLSTVVAIA